MVARIACWMLVALMFVVPTAAARTSADAFDATFDESDPLHDDMYDFPPKEHPSNVGDMVRVKTIAGSPNLTTRIELEGDRPGENEANGMSGHIRFGENGHWFSVGMHWSPPEEKYVCVAFWDYSAAGCSFGPRHMEISWAKSHIPADPKCYEFDVSHSIWLDDEPVLDSFAKGIGSCNPPSGTGDHGSDDDPSSGEAGPAPAAPGIPGVGATALAAAAMAALAVVRARRGHL